MAVQQEGVVAFMTAGDNLVQLSQATSQMANASNPAKARKLTPSEAGSSRKPIYATKNKENDCWLRINDGRASKCDRDGMRGILAHLGVTVASPTHCR